MITHRDYIKKENAEQKRLAEHQHKQECNRIMRRLRIVLKRENEGKTVSENAKRKFLLTPLDLIERSFVKISLAFLYRRYRAVRIQALTECLTIAYTKNKKEELINEIKIKIIEAGQAHKDSKERDKCAVS